jgi:hypothetical protein
MHAVSLGHGIRSFVIEVRPDWEPLLPVGPLVCYHGIMKKKTVIPRKKRGPPATGKGEPVVVRMHPPMLAELDEWIAKQKPPFPSRPEAVRRLVETAFASSRPARYSEKAAGKAKELASEIIDGLMYPSAPAEEKAIRKRRLVKGPSEFRDVRVDQAKSEPK